MYRIGEFSKIVDIPVRTLRFYDEQNVLQPSETDPFTGYRYYNKKNVIEGEWIKLLKAVGFSLEEIVLYKNNLTKEILEKKNQEIIEQIKGLKKKMQKLAIISNELQKSKIRQENLESKSIEEKVLRRKYERRNSKKII